jgi:uracil-DNA glycosylase
MGIEVGRLGYGQLEFLPGWDQNEEQLIALGLTVPALLDENRDLREKLETARSTIRELKGEAPSDPFSSLVAQVSACRKCKLCHCRTKMVFGRGNPHAEMCFVGEAPGFYEDQQGEPFMGKAGQLLDKAIAAMGFERDNVYICNVVKCRPPDNKKPEPVEIAACVPYLREQLRIVSPKVIVALGSTAVEGLLGTVEEGISRLRGQWRSYLGAVPTMPTFHPAYLLRQPYATHLFWDDMCKVLERLGRPTCPSAEALASLLPF